MIFKISVLGMMALEMPAKKMFEPIFGPDPIKMTAKAPESADNSGQGTVAAAKAEDEPMLMDLALSVSEAHAQATPPAGTGAAGAPNAQQGTPFGGDTLNSEEDLARKRQELKDWKNP